MKRFYSKVAVGGDADGFTVELDGRPLRTPAKRPLCLPSQGLAEAVAGEWQAQGETLRPDDMPLTAIACTAIDLVAEQRSQIVAELAGYAGTELLCYRAEAPAELAARQQRAWQPLLDWAALTFDAPLVATCSITAVAQPEQALAALERAVAGHDDLALSALAIAVRSSGSLIVGLALARGRLDAEAAFAAAELDESFNIERWGEDAEAIRRRVDLKRDLAAARRVFELIEG